MSDLTMYLATAGTRKIHMEMAFEPGRGVGYPTCDRHERIHDRIGHLTGEGMTGTIATLAALNIAPSRLCGHCFGRRLIGTYAAQRRAAKAATIR